MNSAPGSATPDLSALAARFRRFATQECAGHSPLYEALSLHIAEDDYLLSLAARSRPGQPPANMLFAAVQACLLRQMEHGLEQGPDQALATFYPSLTAKPHPPEEAFPAFRDYCAAQKDAITALLTSRVVSTNEVQRCACLLPAFGLVAERSDAPLQLIEVGASAGLNLLWDCYAYDYGAAGLLAPTDARLHLTCAVKSAPESFPLPSAMPQVGTRLGIDPFPLDAGDAEDLAWLRALIWPEQSTRAERLTAAAALAVDADLRMLAGDAIEVLPEALTTLPAEGAVCLYHSFTLNQFPSEARARFIALLEELGRDRLLHRIGLEWGTGEAPELTLTRHEGSGMPSEHLALCDAHGSWLSWTAAA